MKRRKYISFLVLLLASASLAALLVFLFTSTSPAVAQPPVAEPPKSFDLKAIDAYVAAKVKEKGLVGLSLVILRDGKPVLVKGYGKACLQGDRAVAPETRFAVGSITKQ